MSTDRKKAQRDHRPHPFAPGALTPTEPLTQGTGEPAHPRPAAIGERIPKVIRHYQHLRCLGAGGMGEVHQYRDTKLQRFVAIKFLRDLVNRANILDEAQAAAQVRHPCVVAIYEVDEAHGFIVFEYVDGQRLDTCIPLASEKLLPIARDIARALAEVHGKGLVHGDIKPANIILEAETDSPKLIDFGLAVYHDAALAREPGGIPGTPAYRAPELAAGHRPSPASDVYAFGVLLHQLATGRLPQRAHGGRDGEGVASRPELLDLIDDCLAADPDARPRDGRAVLERLRRLRQRLNEADDRQIAHQRLQRDAGDWERDGRSADLLWSKRRLDDVRELPAGVALTPREAAFLAASRRRLWQARAARGAIAVGILSLVGLAAMVMQAWLLQNVEHKIQDERQSYEQVRQALDEVRGRRDTIFARLRDDPTGEAALAGWSAVLADLTGLESELHRIDMSLEGALSLAPERDLLRRTMADVLHDRMRLARDLERAHDVRQLEVRMDASILQIENRCRPPVAVALEIHPAPAALAVQRYEVSPDGRFTLVAHQNHTLRQPALRLALAPASYLLTVPASAGRVEVRYPLHIDCDAAPRTITLHRPREDAIPPGFVYVSAGRMRYGFGRNPEQEMLRTWFETVPLHEREVGAFLVSRHETTFQQWIDFLDACARDACGGADARPPRVNAAFPGESPLQLVHTHVGWRLEIRPDQSAGHVVYRADQGQRLVYPARQEPWRAQRWERMPVTGVSWDDVQPYLRWLDTSGRVPGARLCREDEWERAARGADGRIYPHGNVLQPADANHDRTYGRKALAFGLDEVGSHPASASPFGVQDMAGNAWEMVAPWEDDDPSAGYRVLRGGSYYQSTINAVTANRWMIERSDSDSRVGFRVCAPAPAMDPEIREE
jgi:formylglycine-generating enzyme required for sulfatase activity/predicted Ser/Thr protein kinase